MTSPARLPLAAACLALVAVLACGGEEAGPAPQPVVPLPATVSGPLRAGAGVRPLDIPVGHSHAGYLQSRRLGYRHPNDDPGSPFADIFPASRAIQTQAKAKVVVLDNGSSRLVLARLDVIYTTPELTARFVTLAREELGEELSGRLILSATHTHAGPCRISEHSMKPDFLYAEPAPSQDSLAHGGDTYSQESVDRMARSLVGALDDALAGLRPARFGWGSGENLTASHDRRCQDDWIDGPDAIDRQVTVLRLDDTATGDPIAVLFHFAMHGTIYGSQNRSLSVDGPGHAELKLEELFDRPVVAMYLQGTAGDVSPSAGAAGHDGSQAMQRVGWDLARSVRGIWDGIELRDEVKLGVLDRWIPLTHRSLGYAEGEFFPDGGGLCNQFESECRSSRIHEEDLMCLAHALPGGGNYQSHLAVARIDELGLLSMPGEAVSQVGRQLKALARSEGLTEALVLGYALDHEGYILLEDDWWSGGYEPTISFWGWRFAGFAVEQSGDLLRELLTGAAALKLPVTVPAFTPAAYEPARAAGSREAPGIVAELPAELPLLSEARFAFHGGDPVLGTPLVELLREEGAAFAPVLRAGWIPVDNLRSYELPTFYRGSPTFKEAPGAAEREQLWEVVYSPPLELAPGRYRLRATGQALRGGAVTPYELAGAPFQVVPSRALRLEGTLRVEGGELVADVTLLYPALPVAWAPEPSTGWQLGGFRMLDPRFGPAFVPVESGVAALEAELSRDGGASTSLPLVFVSRPLEGDAPPRFAPGAGPGFQLTAPHQGPGHYTLTVPPGALRDASGSSAGEATVLEIDVP